MDLKLEQTASSAIVYDADCIQQPVQDWFDSAYWRGINAIRGTAAGRGNTLMLETDFGPAVMRTYLRGGWAAKFSRDRYLFTGFSRSRPMKETHMLAECSRLGLPVPQPVAGLCLKHGLTYSAVLLTKRIMPAISLAGLLEQGPNMDPDWLRTGRCIRRFHAAGVIHPDLNARNVLFGEYGGRKDDIWLIDFDRAFFRRDSRRLFRANLRRLRRSLLNFWPAGRSGALEACWGQLMKGYNSGI